MKTRIFILALLCTFGFCALPMYGHAALNNTASTIYDSEINTTDMALVIGCEGYIRVILSSEVDQANIIVSRLDGMTVANIDTYTTETTINVAPGKYLVEVWWRKAGTFGRKVYSVTVS